ncbi:MAG: hypothetical protein ACRDQW_11605 [Haloechinothrix sp.]
MRADSAEPVLYQEVGSSYWPLVWAPLLSLAGIGFELVIGSPVHVFGWALVGLVLLLFTTLWVYARRRFLFVRLTTTTLTHGREDLAVERIAAVDDVGAPAGAWVLGGGWSVPRRYEDLPLRLRDDSVVLAWARDAETMRSALRELIAA